MTKVPCPFCSQLYERRSPRQGSKRTCCGDPECVRLRHNQNQRAWHKTPKGQAAAAKAQAKQRALRLSRVYICEHCRAEYGSYQLKRGPYCSSECKWDDVLLEQLLAMDATESLLNEFGFERIVVPQVQVPSWSSSTLGSDFSE